MRLIRKIRITTFALIGFAAICGLRVHAQAALLMEEPYGFFGTLNPTGHNAIYFSRICAETPVKLRRCHPGEMGAVIARYQGIDGFDWVAIPLVPYLYSVETADKVPSHVDRDIVTRLRDRYREAHLESLGLDLSAGSIVHGGWTQLVGAAYERKIYAFRFETTEKEDDAVIARLNGRPNESDFNLLFNNCADFARGILNIYFPHKFRRSIFPDAGMTTPKQIAYTLARYGHKHPSMQLAIFEIPQIPGYRRQSRSNKGIDESFVTTVYAIPITILNPYVTGGLLVDYLARGRHQPIPKNPEVLEPDNLEALGQMRGADQSQVRTAQVPAAASSTSPLTQRVGGSQAGIREVKAAQ